MNYYLAQLKEICNTKFEFSKWIDDKCYYFNNHKVQLFDEAQTICFEKFEEYGFNDGRLFEPEDTEIFFKIYKLAEKFSKKHTLQLWIGLNDRKEEGDFVYNSNGKLPNFTIPWGGN